MSLKERLRHSPLYPPNWAPSLSAARVLWQDLGHLRTVTSRKSVDKAGRPLPWYTYPAIEFLKQLDFSDRTVFEYGSGMSTLFWSARARRVVSVEDDDRWFSTVAAQASSNTHLILETDLGKFPDVIAGTGEMFDVIVVDGPARGRTRLKCCRAALTALRPGGVVILDNSDWLPESSRLLRESGLLEVDMTGFAPICDHVQTTSFYFHRAFNAPPRGNRQPVPGCGAKLDNWESAFVEVPGEVIECEGERYRGVTLRRRVAFATANGVRSFEAFSYLGFDDTERIGIVDMDRARILLTRHRPRRCDGARDLSNEIDRIGQLRWVDFCAFVEAHDHRRYRLTDAGPAVAAG